MPEYNSADIRGCILDIETDYDEFPDPRESKFQIQQVDAYDTITGKHSSFGLGPYKHNKKHPEVGHLDVTHVQYESEYDLIMGFINYFVDSDFDYTCGWNSEKFDMPYIVMRSIKVVGEKNVKRMSPFNRVDWREKPGKFGKDELVVDIVGIPHLDYMLLYQKHNYEPRESYSLDHIAHVELDKAKLTYEEAGSLRNLFEQDPQRYVEYNVVDVDIIKQLDDKLGLLDLTFTLAYYALTNYTETTGTVKIWEHLIAKHLYTQGRIPLFKNNNAAGRDFAGAYVRPPITGYSDWVVSFDLKSLYPHIEMGSNIGPETHVPREQLPPELARLKSQHDVDDLVAKNVDLTCLRDYGYAMTGNFEFYRRDKASFFNEIKSALYDERSMYKNRMKQAKKDVEAIKEEMRKRGIA